MSNRFHLKSGSNNPLVRDAFTIWSGGVEAVLGNKVVRDSISWDGRWLTVQSSRYDLSRCKRIIVVGAGKATASMADGLIAIFDDHPGTRPEIQGWINVPEGTFNPNEKREVYFHAARPAGINEPTMAALHGSRSIMELVSKAEPEDFVVCLISGGASALLPLPVEGVSLEDKIKVTRLLSGRGANIDQLNTVRRSLSQIKDGGLVRACSAKNMVTLVLSDVLGDPLHLIGSGPTWLDNPSDPKEAWSILNEMDPTGNAIPVSIKDYLSKATSGNISSRKSICETKVSHFVIGNNGTAIERARQVAESLNYRAVVLSTDLCEGDVATVARKWLAQIRSLPQSENPICLITGGEPTVRLPESGACGLGGRNQQLILQMLTQILGQGFEKSMPDWIVLSAGTDGEDGPTDAAGAWISQEVVAKMQQLELDPNPFLAQCNAYPFFRDVGGLLLSGPTGTNVCDLRVAMVGRGD